MDASPLAVRHGLSFSKPVLICRDTWAEEQKAGHVISCLPKWHLTSEKEELQFLMEEVKELCVAWCLCFLCWVFYRNSRHLLEKMVLHLQCLDSRTPPVARWWHFYLGPEGICGRQNSLEPLIASRWAARRRDRPQPRRGASWGDSHVLSLLLYFQNPRGSCACRTAAEAAVTAGEHGPSPVPTQWFLHSHVNGAVCEGKKHTPCQVQGSGPMSGGDILYVAFTENGNEISCFTTRKNSSACSEVDKITSVLV